MKNTLTLKGEALKFLNLVLGISLVLAGLVVSADALIDPSLKTFGLQKGTQNVQRVLVLVKVQSDLPRPARYANRLALISYFKESSRRALMPIMQDIQSAKIKGISHVQPFWLNGSFAADVTAEALFNLSHHASVTKIYRNARVVNDPVGHGRFNSSMNSEDAKDYAFASIGLDKLAAELPQVTGKNVVVGIVDTGVDGEHPALKGKVPLFYNGQTKTTTPPKDFDTHGTHVSGTVAGGDRATNNIGIAPEAKIIMAGVVNQGFDAMLAGMQWFLDTEKNPVVATKVKVIGCSWNTGGAPDQEVFYRAIAAWEASGILPVFSAGNAGMRGITPPHEYPGTFAVAAYGADGKVAEFSSRGPGHYKGKDTQKPDLAAPGVDIRSSVPNGGYQLMSGTSMAQPHVTGTIALLLQVNPTLNPQQIREVLVRSASPTEFGPAGQWSKEYGFGKLNAYAAVKSASVHLQQMGNLFTNSMTLLSSPEAIDLQAFAANTFGEVGGQQDQYEDTDNSAWLTTSQFYN